MIDFVFLRPWWLLGAVACFAAMVFLYQGAYSKSGWWDLMDQHIARSLIISKGSHRLLTPLNLLLALIGFICIALAGPSTGKQLPDELRSKASVIVLMANSDSMYAGDISPNRNRVAKQKLRALRSYLPESQFGLIAYAYSAHQVSPLTSDPKFMDFYLNPLEPKLMPDREQLTSGLLDALESAEGMLKNAHYPVNILIMADKLSAQDSDAIVAFGENQRVAIEVLAMGTEAGGALRFVDSSVVANGTETQMELAPFEQLKTKGVAMLGVMQNEDDVEWIAAKIKQSVAEANNSNPEFSARDSGYWLALLLIPICLMLFRKKSWILPNVIP